MADQEQHDDPTKRQTAPLDAGVVAPPSAAEWWNAASDDTPTPPAGIVVPQPVVMPVPIDSEEPAQETQATSADEAPSADVETAETAENAVVGQDETRQLDEQHAPALSPRRSVQGLAACALRDIGRVRNSNQDSVFSLLTTLPRENADMPLGLFVVADGMGGHEGGEVASRLAVYTVVQQVLAQLVLPALSDGAVETLQPLMIGAVQEANRTIWQHAQSIGSDMGTTCTAALLLGSALYIAHVGDSRAYLYEPGGIRPLTADHSAVGRLIQLGHLDVEEAREHPLRNQLYRTVGQQPDVPVDFVYQPIGQSSHVLLCSDGLWGLVNERQMEQALSRSPWPQDTAEELIALANLAGGDDNISAVVVCLPMAERSA
jgi:serine/threonine protein phosphatase PrpC